MYQIWKKIVCDGQTLVVLTLNDSIMVHVICMITHECNVQASIIGQWGCTNVLMPVCVIDIDLFLELVPLYLHMWSFTVITYITSKVNL